MHTLPPLAYDYNALEPHIDEMTMRIHHTKHHQAYVNNLNAALEAHPSLQSMTVEELMWNLDDIPEEIRTAVHNNGGGHANHSMFWELMGPHGGGEPGGELADALRSTFDSIESFREQFAKAGMTRFGSGWAWLSLDDSGKLLVESSANQDGPLMARRTPILTVDVWEHAYYLKYQNRRADYLAAWWNTVNWSAVAERYTIARG